MRTAALALAGLVAAGAADGQTFRRDVAPFAVRDSAGTVLRQPFLGGLARPRPHLADLDGDGDLDLVVQERAGAAMRFDDVGGGTFVWRTDRMPGLDPGEWLRFVDVDGDERPDVLTERPFGYVRFYTATAEGGYRLVTDTVRTTTGAPVFVDRQNLPALGDLDGDGRPDLLYAQVDGTLTFYAGADRAPSGAPRFLPPVDGYQGIEIIGAFGKAADPKHGASALSLVDVDGDGDLDVVWGDFFSPSLYLVRNDGTRASPRLVRAADTFPAASPVRTPGFNATAWGDFLGSDGRTDLIVGVVGGAFGAERQPEPPLLAYAGTDAGLVPLPDPVLPMLDVGTNAVPALADFDDDGDVDLVMGTEDGRLVGWQNTGTAAAPVFAPVAVDAPRVDAALAPAAADLDGDGRADLAAGRFDGQVRFWRRTGPFRFEDAGTLAAPPRAQRSAPALADLDGDGDADLVVGEASGDVNRYRNDGTRAAPTFALVTEAVVPRAPRSVRPALADLDGDGDADLVLGLEDGTLQRVTNTGTPAAPAFTGAAVLADAHPTPAPTFADADADGDPDLFVGAEGGGLLFFRNVGAAPPDTPADALRARPPTPNPARGTITLPFDLLDAARVGLVVSDALGRVVREVVPEAFGAGPGALPLDVAAWPAGVYLYRFTVSGQSASAGRFVVVP